MRSFGTPRLVSVRRLALTLVCAFSPAICVSSCGTKGTAVATSDAMPPAPDITLTNVCTELPALYCNQDAPCCKQAGFTFDQTGCQASYSEFCRAGVAAVMAGRATFHTEKIQECIRSLQPFYDQCILSGADWAASDAAGAPCALVFQGNVPVGGSCNSSPECSGATTFCNTGTCGTFVLAKEGQPCGDGCASGLVCGASMGFPVCVSAGPAPIVSSDGCNPGVGPSSTAPDGSAPGASDPRIVAACGRLVDVSCAKLVECKVVSSGTQFSATLCAQTRARSLLACEQSRAAGISGASDADVDACVAGLGQFPCGSLCNQIPQDPAVCSRLGFEPETMTVMCAP